MSTVPKNESPGKLPGLFLLFEHDLLGKLVLSRIML
jgi:hypothetical protein